jgi:hypothetical protein
MRAEHQRRQWIRLGAAMTLAMGLSRSWQLGDGHGV